MVEITIFVIFIILTDKKKVNVDRYISEFPFSFIFLHGFNIVKRICFVSEQNRNPTLYENILKLCILK